MGCKAHCFVDGECRREIEQSQHVAEPSLRALHSVAPVTRTIAGLAASPRVRSVDVVEVIQFRRYGDANLFWMGS